MKKNKEHSDQIAWHYTTARHFQSIMEDGLIRPAILYVPVNERPVVWFSLAPHWEPTASPMIMKNGIPHMATMREIRSEAGHLLRFGVPKSGLIPWKKLRKAANIDPELFRALAKSGRAQGANPANWYGSIEDVPVRDCRIEAEAKPGNWRDISDHLMSSDAL